jgi:hypothetical protein
MHEHFRKRDKRRKTNMHKLHIIEESLFKLPGVGEMMRAETARLMPAAEVLRAQLLNFTPERDPAGEYFDLDHHSLKATKQREAEYEEMCQDLIGAWSSFGLIGQLGDTTPEAMPGKIHELSLSIRNDPDGMREFYRKHRLPHFPLPEMIDENWTFFRWVQVQLLGGVGYYASYGVENKPSIEKLMHELFDLIYLISAVLVGGLACRDEKFIERFRLLRPDGVLLRH